jgi:putative spermidine/putrescine transport system substrate-binding protein
MRLRKLTMSLVSATSALLLVACGGGGGGGGGDAAPSIDLGSGPPQAGVVKKDALKGITMSFASYGGIYQQGQESGGVQPFAAESGAKVLSDGPTDYAKIKAQVESGNVTWDVVDTGSTFALANCGTLFMKLDTKIVDTSHAPKELVSECAVPSMTYGYVMVYNKTKFGANPPTSWADFFDTTKFPGKRGLPGIASDIEPGILEGALVADGVARDKLYPLDVDKALKKLDTIRADAVFWDTGARAQQLIESGEVDLAWMWSGRALAGIKNGADFAANWNDFSPVFDTLVVPVGAKNPQASFALINYMIGKSAQEKLTEATSYSPIHDEAQPQVDELTQSFITTAKPKEQALPIDNTWWSENQADVITKWSDWLAG